MTLDLATKSGTRYQKQQIKKIDKLDYIKIQSFYASKDMINRVKRPPTEWEKIFANHISDKGLISRIFKEFLQLNNKKANNQL